MAMRERFKPLGAEPTATDDAIGPGDFPGDVRLSSYTDERPRATALRAAPGASRPHTLPNTGNDNVASLTLLYERAVGRKSRGHPT